MGGRPPADAGPAEEGGEPGLQHDANVHGVIANTANYPALREEPIVKDVIAGVPIRRTGWVDWNPLIDELSSVEYFRHELVARVSTPGRRADRHVPQRLGRLEPADRSRP